MPNFGAGEQGVVLLGLGRIVREGVCNAHKLFRDSCRLICDSKPRERKTKMDYSPLYGQSDCSQIYQQTGRDEVETAGRGSQGSLEMLPLTGYIPEGGI